MAIFARVLYLSSLAALMATASAAEYHVQCGRGSTPKLPSTAARWDPKVSQGADSVAKWGVKPDARSSITTASGCKTACDNADTCVMYQINDKRTDAMAIYDSVGWSTSNLKCTLWHLQELDYNAEVGYTEKASFTVNDGRVEQAALNEAKWDNDDSNLENFKNGANQYFCKEPLSKLASSPAECPSGVAPSTDEDCFAPAGLYLKKYTAALPTTTLCGQNSLILDALTGGLANSCIHPATHAVKVGQNYDQSLALITTQGASIDAAVCSNYKTYKAARDLCAQDDASRYPFFTTTNDVKIHLTGSNPTTGEKCASYVYGGCLRYLAPTNDNGVGAGTCCKDTYAEMIDSASWTAASKLAYKTAATAACQSDYNANTDTKFREKLVQYYEPWQWNNQGFTFYETNYCDNGSSDLTAGASPLLPGAGPFLAIVTLVAVAAQDLVRFYT